MNKETDLILESLKASGTHEMDLPYIEAKGDSVTIDGSLNVDDLRIIVSELEKQKTRTKTEFVKCEYGDKVSNIVMDFENNAPLYKSVNDEYWTIDELDDLFHLILNYCHIYRKVETEIDERQEFIDECMFIGGLRSRDGAGEVYGNLYDSGKFKLVE